MTTQKYLCPPRLQKKFLLWWWTVPELIGIALGAVLVFYLRSPQIFTLTCFLALGTARFDFENNLFGALKMRTAYQFFTKTFSQNAASGKDEKRRKKKLRRLMKSKLPMQELLQFRFGENGIYGGKDGKELFRFYRYYPPNTDVMTDGEIAEEIEQLCRLFDSLRCPFVMFGTDKVEDMSALKAYYRSQPRQYDHIIADVINEIESTEARSSAVQRAYYFIYKAQNEDDDIYTLIAGKGYKVDRVKNEELAVLLRNYLVREFTNVDLYTIAEEVKNYPDMVRAKPAVYNKEIMRRLCPNRIDFVLPELPGHSNRPQRHHTAAVRFEREHNPLRRGRSGTKGPAGSVCPARSGRPQDLQSVQAPAAVRRMGQAAGRSIQPG